MRFRTLFLLLSALFLSACTQDMKDFAGNLRRIGSSYGDKVDPGSITYEELKKSQYGYLMGRFNGRNEWIHTSVAYNDFSIDSDKKVELQYNSMTEDELKLYKLVPGKYTLIFFTVDQGGTTYRAVDSEKDENETLKNKDAYFLSFEINPGEILYLGNIDFKRVPPSVTQTYMDDIANKSLKEVYKFNSPSYRKGKVVEGYFFRQN